MERQYTAKQCIDALRRLKEKPVDSAGRIQVLKTQIIAVLRRAFGPDSRQEEEVRKIKRLSVDHREILDFYGRILVNPKKAIFRDRTEAHLHDLIDAFIEELDTFGLPPAPGKADSSDKININLNQNQVVSVNAVLVAFQEELTGRQVAEIKEVLSSDLEPDEKKFKLIDKVKSFGNDVASNIVASILTNPQILGVF